jgi:2,5-diamino-6-(ribosylamino)-4(3H)-pyrimidinone 5'-phosphate reductase
MLSSVDGKIDGAALDAVMDKAEYEATAAKLNGDAWICGRTTMQQHFAEDVQFVSASNTLAGPRPVFVARRAKSYAISVDTLGKLRWPDGDLGSDHLIVVVSEQVAEDYLAKLREKGISYIVCRLAASVTGEVIEHGLRLAMGSPYLAFSGYATMLRT